MYYSKTLLGGYKSHIVSSTYFLSPEGKTNPLAELKASLEAFRLELPAVAENPQCRFPNRYLLLKDHFSLAPPIECKKLADWRASYEPERIDLVYTAQYISNPASVFGHLFLVAKSPKPSMGFWLTFNFAAGVPKETSALAYIWGGLTGWFTGDYSILPYFQRLKQYGDIENRDIFELHLKMNKRELDRLLNHLWELVHYAKFQYYFMDENCAGVLLRTLGVIFPELTSQINDLSTYVSPLKVAQVLQSHGRIQKTVKRPSLYNVVKSHVLNLNSKEQDQFYHAISQPNKTNNFSSPKISEAIIEYLTLQTQKNSGVLPEKFKALQRSSYISRAKSMQPRKKTVHEILPEDSPVSAHDPFALTTGFSVLNGQNVLDLSYRFTMHSLLDPEPGFLKNSNIEGLHIQASYKDNAFWIRRFDIINLENYQPAYRFSFQPSWRIRLGWLENKFTKENLFDNYFATELGVGLTKEAFAGLDYYLMAVSKTNIGSEATQSHYELGPEAGIILTLNNSLKFLVKSGYLKGTFDANQKERIFISSGLRYSLSKSLSLIQKIDWSKLPTQNQEANRTQLGLRYYF